MIIIDIETTGLDPKRHCMLSLGAVDYVTGEDFYGECHVYGDSLIDPEALAINGCTVERCTDLSKPSPGALYLEFFAWTRGREPLLAGQQVGSLDIPFLRAIHTREGIIPMWSFGYRSVDLHSVAYAKLGKSLNLDGILTTLGLAPEPKPHNALTGARLERDAFKLLLNS